MKSKDIDLMREIRLWIVQIGLPIAGLVVLAKNPDILIEIKNAIKEITRPIMRGNG